MAKRRKKRKTKEKETHHIQSGIRKEIVCILAIALAVLMAFSVITDQTGLLGKVLGTFLLGLFGIGSYLIPFLVIVFSVRFLWKKQAKGRVLYEGVLWSVFTLMVMTFFHLLFRLVNPQAGQDLFIYFEWGSYQNGGLIGALAGNLLYSLLGPVGACILLMALGIVLFVLSTGRSFFGGIEKAYSSVHTSYKKTSKKKKERKKLAEDDDIKLNIHDQEEEPLHNTGGIFDFSAQFAKEEETAEQKEEIFREDISIGGPLVEEAVAPVTGTVEMNSEEDEKEEPIQFQGQDMDYEFPAVDLLGLPPSQSFTESKAEMLNSAKKLEETLKSFGVVAKVVQINKGPSVTRYELTPNQGVKVAKIVNLADDIALSLAAAGIRIEAPIPGKSAVGIEVPNKEQKSVFFREVLDDENFKNMPSKLAFGLGKDIAGQTVVADIAKMPHLLIAGATGSGKSVCINTLICSLIYKANPDEVKLIMVDPKVVELSVYNGIPHLMIPVVTDPKKAASALHWAVQEMLKRYKLFAEKNVRDLKGYNQALLDEQEEGFLPQIVIIIDELADLMMAAPNEVEDSICRLAQMARAAGMHLIIATQRPSVDVITGLIKANIPSRLAFAVTSGTDSRTILDMVGAEKLLGKGDMLFHPVGMAKPQRIQGAFITDKEVEKIVQAIRPKEPVNYDEEVLEKITSGTAETSLEDKDELFDKAVELLLTRDKASTSMIQREFRIGYNRAARIMEDMQKMGIVGNDDGSKFKKMLINSVQWEEMKNRKETGGE